MQIPAKPVDEESRIVTLRSLNLLDTDRDERFDRLTRLALHVFEVPVALVSLVDENRQWFKSCQGANLTETDRDVSFCGHAILGDEAFVIEDTHQDPRFADNPLVIGEPHIRFYAGYPIRYLDGVLGILPPNTAKTVEGPVFTGLQATINFNLARVSVSSSAFGSKNEQNQATINSHCR